MAGGGLTGASLAVALADLGLKVAVVEAHPPESPRQPSLDDRTSAIARTGVRILENLGVWPRLAETPSPIRAVEISERGCFGGARIDAASQELDSLGSVVRNRVLGQALWDKLRESDCIDIFCPAAVNSVEVESGQVSVSVRPATGNSKTVRARLLAVAEGARSPLREKFGIQAEHREYPQVALTGLAEVRKVVRPDTAWERFTADGPLAVLPAGGRRYGFVIVSNRGGEKLAELNDADLLECLQELMGYRAGEFVAVGSARRLSAGAGPGGAGHGAPFGAGGRGGQQRPPAGRPGIQSGAARHRGAVGNAGCRRRAFVRPRRSRPAGALCVVAAAGPGQRGALYRRPGAAEAAAPWLRPLRGLGMQAFDVLPQARPMLARFALGQGRAHVAPGARTAFVSARFSGRGRRRRRRGPGLRAAP